MITHLDLEYKKGLYLNLFLPESDSFDLFVYLHGGGLKIGSRKSGWAMAETLAKHNIATASIDYSLYPDAQYPDFIVDSADSLRWLKDNISQFGNCKRIFVGGSSAGGYISMMLCFDEKYLRNAGLEPSDIAGYIHDSGQPTAHFQVLEEAGMDKRRLIVDETAPLYFVGTQETYPPMLFLVSDNDMFARYEQIMLMIKTLNHFGHKDNIFFEMMHGKHCEHVYQKDDNGNGVFGTIIASFMNKVE